MRVKKLLHTRMRVSDIDQTIRFYTDVLGLEVVERKTSPRGSHLAFLKVPNSEELIELASFPPSGAVKVQEDLVHLAFQVENLDKTIAELKSKGVAITDGPTSSSSGSRSARVLGGASPPWRHLPLSQPPASGLHGITAMPYCWQTGSTSASTPRTSIE